MKIIYRHGDLLGAGETHILHGCNAQGVMGSGVAKAIRDKYPSAYLFYHGQFVFQKELHLGTIITSIQQDGVSVHNAITQQFYGRDAKRYVSYDAIADVITRLDVLAMQQGFSRVAMPKIGAGLGGGNWHVISEIIEQYSENFQPVVYCL